MKAISAAIVFLGSVLLFASSKVGGSYYQGMIVTVACLVALVSFCAWAKAYFWSGD